MPNIHFIRAAILDVTGVNLTLEQTRDYLVTEGLITPAKARAIIFRGYAEFYDNYVAKEEKTTDLLEIMAPNEENI